MKIIDSQHSEVSIFKLYLFIEAWGNAKYIIKVLRIDFTVVFKRCLAVLFKTYREYFGDNAEPIFFR